MTALAAHHRPTTAHGNGQLLLVAPGEGLAQTQKGGRLALASLAALAAHHRPATARGEGHLLLLAPGEGLAQPQKGGRLALAAPAAHNGPATPLWRGQS